MRHFHTISRRLVRVHHQHWATFLNGPVDLREHRTELQVLIDADAASPDSSADGAHSLNDDKACLAGVRSLHQHIRPVELLAHEDWASSARLGPLHLRRTTLRDLNLHQTILIDHLALNEGQDTVADVVVLSSILFEVELVIWEQVAADLRVHEILKLLFGEFLVGRQALLRKLPDRRRRDVVDAEAGVVDL